jgi:hypothetical protein
MTKNALVSQHASSFRDRNRTEFPSMIHRIVHWNAVRLTPLEKSTAGIADASLLESCRDCYGFFVDLLRDMWQNPTGWGVTPGEYEAAGCDCKPAQLRQLPKKVQDFRVVTQHFVEDYMHLLRSLALFGSPRGEGLDLTKEGWDMIRRHFDKNFSKKVNIAGVIPLETRLEALRGAGLQVAVHPAGASVTSETHPKMFAAMSVLAKSAYAAQVTKKKSEVVFGEHNFCCCDFRQMKAPYNPTWEDVFQPLPDNDRAVAEAVHAAALELKCRPSVVTFWKVNYHYKGAHIMTFYAPGPENAAEFRVDGSHRTEYLSAIEAEGADFAKYFRCHLTYCRACSPSHIGMKWNVLGHIVRLCIGPNFKAVAPQEADLPYIRKMIALRMAEVDAGVKMVRADLNPMLEALNPDNPRHRPVKAE